MKYTLDWVSREDMWNLLSLDFREDDLQELSTVHGCPRSMVGQIVADLCLKHPYCLCIKLDGKICMVGGVVPKSLTVGTVWAVGTNQIDKGGKEFALKMREALRYFFLYRPVLENSVDSRNVRHIKWLKWEGFTFTSVVQVIDDVEFLHFAKVMQCVE